MDYELGKFEAKVREALERVRLVLDAEKNPTLPSELHHQYEDKYLLAEYLTNTAAASQLNCLSILGISAEQVLQLQEWAKTSAVSLRLRSEESCTYLREETREVEDPTKHVTDVSVGGVISKTFTSKVVTKVTEYFWKFEVSYELLAVRGVGEQPSDRIQILARTGSDELKTSAKSSPKPERVVPAANFEVQVSWLLRQLPAGAMSPAFKVDRTAQACKTPRRNPEVEGASTHFARFRNWAQACLNYLEQMLRTQPDPTRKLDLNFLQSRPTLVSVLPLMVRSDAQEGNGNAPQEAAGSAAAAVRTLACLSSSGGQLLSPQDANRLLSEEARMLEELRSQVKGALPSSNAVATAAEGCMIVVLRQCGEVCQQWSGALDYIENLLRKQLIAAIGKEVQPSDFAEYMRFHNRKLFAEGYLPLPFCFAVRRSAEHAPEGTLSLEQNVGGEIATPIVTMVAQSEGLHQMQFPLSASTNVRFGGERYLHAWLNHKFSGDTGALLSLVARARQFSSMLVLVGRIASATVFEPKYAAIIQNKDELTIPLELSTIPTPKEFKDAVESLSPEMRSFAKAFRAMQLESTLFGVLVIHIKPQLEKVLNLAPDSLTKEIKLTQDLMQLFIKYQIPSDLLSFDASAAAAAVSTDGAELLGGPTPAERLAAVKAHVTAMQEMIEKAKQEELNERRMEVAFDQPHLMMLGGAPPTPVLQSVSMSMAQDCAMDLLCMDECAAVPQRAACTGFGAPPAPPPVPCMAMAAPAPRMAMMSAPVPASFAAPVPRPPASSGSVQPQPQPQPQQPRPQPSEGAGNTSVGSAGPVLDYTQVPKELDQKFEAMDKDSSLRPTIINVGDTWEKRAQKALLAKPETSVLGADEQKTEKEAAFDLLDGLTKSGALSVSHAALHVVIAATHCFDKTVLETVVKDNVNPIDKVERSTLIMATTVHRQPATALIQQSQQARVQGTSPMLFLEDQL